MRSVHLSPDQVEGAGVRRPLVVGVALGRGDGGDGGTSARDPAVHCEASQNSPPGGVTVVRMTVIRHGRDDPTGRSSPGSDPRASFALALPLLLGTRRPARTRRSADSRQARTMGDVIRLTERRRRRAARAARAGPPRGALAATAEFYFDLVCPFTYLARRARRARPSTRSSGRPPRRSRCAARASRTTTSAPPRCAAPRSARAADAAHAARLARALPRRRDGRHARRRAARAEAGRGAALRARGDAARVLRRLRPRRPGDPGRGGRGRRRGRSTTACAPPGTRAATARSRPPAAALLAVGADRLPALRVGPRALLGRGARRRGAVRGPRRARRPRCSRKFSRAAAVLASRQGGGAPRAVAAVTRRQRPRAPLRARRARRGSAR